MFNSYIFYCEINFTIIKLSYKNVISLFSIKQLIKLWKKTFKTIHQLSCFVGHPVLEIKTTFILLNSSVIRGIMIENNIGIQSYVEFTLV